MIEIAPTEYWEQIPINQAKLYCFSLTIDGKVGWRLPTQQEYNHYAAIQPAALFQEQLKGFGPDNHFLKLVIPVRDLQETYKMIEIAPKEYWKYLTLEDAILYCFSLNIDNKIGWRLPTREEYEQTAGIPHFALHESEFNRMSKSALNYDAPLRIVPVRDVL